MVKAFDLDMEKFVPESEQGSNSGLSTE